MRWVVLALFVGSLVGCSEDKPVATGPTVHCFNQKTGKWEQVNTGKVTVTCPTGE